MPAPPCTRCCDRARRDEIAGDDIQLAAVTLQGDMSGEIIHLCQKCFEANCKGGMEEGDAVTVTRDMTLSTEEGHPGQDDARRSKRRN